VTHNHANALPLGACSSENGGETEFADLHKAYLSLSAELKETWGRYTSVNSNSGVLHPMVYPHPISGETVVYLHLGMTGAVIETRGSQHRTLDHAEMTQLFNTYNDLLNDDAHRIVYAYQPGDMVMIDNLAVAHRANPSAHAASSGLRILHRTTVKSTYNHDPLPETGLPHMMDMNTNKNPFGEGIWQGGGLGFRWDASIRMQN